MVRLARTDVLVSGLANRYTSPWSKADSRWGKKGHPVQRPDDAVVWPQRLRVLGHVVADARGAPVGARKFNPRFARIR